MAKDLEGGGRGLRGGDQRVMRRAIRRVPSGAAGEAAWRLSYSTVNTALHV